MKHISLSFIAVGLLLLCGCSEENLKVIPNLDPNAIPLHFYASMESQQDSTASTRATLSGTSTDDTRKVLWEPSDSIYVTNGKFGAKFSNVTEEDADVAEFSGKLGLGTEYYAAFPYGFVGDFVSPAFQLTLPTVQKYKADGIASESFPMVARCINNVFEFKNLCGILVLNLTGSQSIDSIRFSGKSDTIKTIKVSGPASVDMTYTDIPSLVVDSAANDYVILNCINSEGKGATLNTTNPTPFHIVLPAETYAFFTIVIYSSDGKHMTINSEKPLTIKRSKRTTASSITFLADKPVYEFVDLGLSVVWAIHNVGTNKPGEIGEGYSWGELQTKDSYSWNNYYYNPSGGTYENVSLSKYNTIDTWGVVDSLITLELKDDIASVEWGDEWRMPTREEIDELINHCNWTWKEEDIDYYHIARGYRISSKEKGFTNNSIFMPITDGTNQSGKYWSSSLKIDEPRTAWTLSFTSWGPGSTTVSRSYNQYVRPVKPSQNWIDQISISLDRDSISLNKRSTTSLSATITKGENTYVYLPTWSSNNPSVASVDEYGVITSHVAGNAIITADCKGKTATCKVTVTEPGYVDLGLSVLWATCNIGANSPNDQGYYYAWGEIENRKDFRAEKYKWYRIDNNDSKIIKYNYDSSKGYNGYTDGKYLLDINDDVAHEIWGGEWRLPTVDEIQELINNCTWTSSGRNYIIVSNVPGYADSPVILPKCGSYNDTEYQDIRAGYWSNSISKDDPFNANSLILSSSNIYGVTKSLRRNGFYVRPVRTSDSYLNKLSISLDKASESVQLDGSVNLKATTRNGDRTVTHTIEWSSNDPSVATVDENGVVTGHKIGTAIISANCKGKTASCTVTITEPESVELGLSVKWAVCNVGASKVTDYGNAYAWGELEPKSSYGWANYTLAQGTESSITRYCFDATSGYNGYTDSKTTLDSSDDIAHMKWGGNWRMPSSEEFDELLKNCNWQWTTIDGVYGYKISSKVTEYKDNYIFLPSESAIHRSGLYWSSTLGTTKANQAYRLQFNETSYCELYEYMRCLGHVIRPVSPSQSWLNNLSISLNEESLSIKYGVASTLVATVKNGSNAMDYPITWSSNKPEVATVDENGVITCVSVGTATITATCHGKTATCTVTIEEPDPEYVDLGLSVHWATFNIGAIKPEGYGDYFAWAEKETKNTYSWETYYWSLGYYPSFTKYNTDNSFGSTIDNNKVLDIDDDIAHIKWGVNWRIPTSQEFNELITNCSRTWATQNGVNGYRFTGKNGNSIFLPAAGQIEENGSLGTGTDGFYWSSTLGNYPNAAKILLFNNNYSGHCSIDAGNRYTGFTVRPVYLPESWLNKISVSISDESKTILVDKTYKLTAIVKYDNTEFDTEVEWSTGDPSIATISKDGVVTGITVGTTTITASCYGKSSTCDVTIYDYEYVDLGLSVNWATFNIGADKPEAYGEYYSWGEVETKANYSWSTYKLSKGSSSSITKYCTDNVYGSVDNKTILESGDDVASTLLGNRWRTPTKEDYLELKQNCYWTWTTVNGIDGYLITGKRNGYTNNSIFLPASGRKTESINNNGNIGTRGFYWSSEISSPCTNAWYLYFHDEGSMLRDDNNDRSNGLMIRPVATSSNWNITSVIININQLSLNVDEEEQLEATIKVGDDNMIYPVEWVSDKPAIATVDDNGLVTAISAGSATITASCKGKTASCTVIVTLPNPEYVDLGLSVNWATFNINATSPEKAGKYYAWAITSGSKTRPSNPSPSSYKYIKYEGSTGKYTKYCSDSDRGYYGFVDNKTTIDQEDDVAYLQWGEQWRIPSYEEFSELINNCTWTWTTLNSVYGYRITSNRTGYKDKSIFLPITNGDTYVGFDAGYYWSSSIASSAGSAYYLRFEEGDYKMVSRYVYYQEAIRPVSPSATWGNDFTITLDENQVNIRMDQSFTLSATVKDGSYDVDYFPVVWSTDNIDVADVDQNGYVINRSTYGTATVTATCKGKTASCRVVVAPEPEYVDLGLSVNWATFNVGAYSSVGFGNYYSWGETDIKDDYNMIYYKYYSSGNSFTNYTFSKYNTKSDRGVIDNKTELELEDDVAYVEWGGRWRMPKREEIEELKNNCSWEWITIDGVQGYIITSNIPGYTENHIFLPAAGSHNADGMMHTNSIGYYWSKTLCDDSFTAWAIYFQSTDYLTKFGSIRNTGYPIRPVCQSDTWQNNITINLDCDELLIIPGEKHVYTPTMKNGSYDYSYPIEWSSSNPSVASIDKNGILTAVSEGNAVITASCMGKTSTCDVVVAVPEYEYVDLGLSVNWATFNVGAFNPEDYGHYYAWGEKSYKTQYEWMNYYYRMDGDSFDNITLSKYIRSGDDNYGAVDNQTQLSYYDDVANIKWGSDWRMPTNEEFTELKKNCTWEKVTINNISGYKVTSNKNGYTDKWIFLPAAGQMDGSDHVRLGYDGYYWSSSLSTGSRYAFALDFGPNGANLNTSTGIQRRIGLTIRPVKPKYEYVDLGLSVKWATYNIGATKPEESGKYYAWGEIETNNYYDWATYKYCNGEKTKLTKYCNLENYGNNGYTDSRTVLDSDDDIAHMSWGGSWRIPTQEEFNELKNNCTWTWTSMNDVNGYLVTSKKNGYTDRSIFLPVVGLRTGSSLIYADWGYYWCGSLLQSTPSNADVFSFDSGLYGISNFGRNSGLSVRPVCP